MICLFAKCDVLTLISSNKISAKSLIYLTNIAKLNLEVCVVSTESEQRQFDYFMRYFIQMMIEVHYPCYTTKYFSLISCQKSTMKNSDFKFAFLQILYFTILQPCCILNIVLYFLLRYNTVIINNITCYVLILLNFSYEIYRVHLFIGC